MENSENQKINITPKDKPEIKITKKSSPEILITQRITDTLKIENVSPLTRDKFNVGLKNREDIKRIVEVPLVKACEVFWDKNIKTVATSANQENIQNEDFEKFWNSVKEEDIKNLVVSYEDNKVQQLKDFEKYKGKYQEGDFVPELGGMLSHDTSWWDNKISDLNSLLK